MKYNIFLKAIALLLCTLSLFGIAAGGFGILALTETGLYNQTVDQLIQSRVQTQGEDLANTIAVRYASTTLGGVPGQLVSQLRPIPEYGVLSGNYGYALLDAEGTVLEQIGSSDGEGTRVLRFPVGGKYLHLVSLMSEGEKYPSFQPDPQYASTAIMTDDLYLYQDIPEEGAVLFAIHYTPADSGTMQYSDGQGIGTVSYLPDGRIACLFTHPDAGFPINTHIGGITLVGLDGKLLYEASAAAGVGYFTHSGNAVMFVATVAPEPVPVETVPPTVPPTVPETQPETVPETTAETVPPTTEPAIVLEVEDNLPDEGVIEVVELEATLDNGEEVYHLDEYGIGRIHRDEDGVIHFTSYDSWESEVGDVIYIHFLDADGETLFGAYCEEGIGSLYLNEHDSIAFESDLPVIPEETVPETTAATVPPTVPETVPETTAVTVPATEETVPVTTEPILIDGKPLSEFDILTEKYFDHETQQTMYAEFVYVTMPAYTVELYLTQDSIANSQMYLVLNALRNFRDLLLPVLIFSILLLLLTGVYLVFAAGRTPRSEAVLAGGLNRIPLDLYLVILGMGVPLLLIYAMEGGNYLLRSSISVGIACGAGLAYFACVLVIGFLFAAVAQIKTGNGYWWKNTLFSHCFRLFLRFGTWLETVCRRKLFPVISLLSTKLWDMVCRLLVWVYRNTEKLLLRMGLISGRFLRWAGRLIHRFLSLLPLTWQWLVSGFMMFLLVAVSIAANGEEILVVLCICVSISMIVYGAHCFGTLLDSTKKMRKGNLNIKVDDKMMVGSFKEFAGELNELAGVAVVAAQKQLNSERMKSELITNVSHDIKTPLTSIINYVDLLQKPHTEEEGEQYLEVLERQSLQLKKLLDDLMDMSKASTGNMAVEITCMDAVEAVNQALGEFSDKLDRARLTPVFRHTEISVPMMADGRLVWRVLNNLLGNAVKYAMPGTRLYLDLATLEDTVVLSLKNVSREELNINAEELMERFVRGDGSRNTEGSGLGLNIAKSLVELQHGQMQLLVDGDLFKVTLIFPAAE